MRRRRCAAAVLQDSPRFMERCHQAAQDGSDFCGNHSGPKGGWEKSSVFVRVRSKHPENYDAPENE